MIVFDECIDISDFLFKYQQEFLDDLDLRGKDDHTYNKYKSVTTYFIDYVDSKKPFRKIEDINHKEIYKFINFRELNANRLKDKKKGFQYSTKLSYKTVLQLFFEFIELDSDDEYSFNVKWKRIEFKKDSKQIKHMSNDNLKIALKYLDNLKTRALKIKDFSKLNKNQKKEIKSLEHVYTLNFTFKLGVNLGLRAEEICNLKLENFSKPYRADTGESFVDVFILGKGSKERTLPIYYKTIKNELDFYRKIRKQNEQLFRQVRGGVMTRFSLYNYFKELAEYNQTKEKGCHILRHTFTFVLGENDTDLAVTQDALGHSDPSTTRIYLPVSPKRLRQAASKIAIKK